MKYSARKIPCEQKVAAASKNHQRVVGRRKRGEDILQFIDGVELDKTPAFALDAKSVVLKKLKIPNIFHNTKFINADTHQATPVV